MTCLVALLVATLLWLLIRRRKPAKPTSAAAEGMQTVTDLPAFLRQHPEAIVLFHASWRSHCKKLLPSYAKAATSNSLPMGAMNCDEAEDIIKQYKLRGFPTILRFRNGTRVDEYHGDRSVKDLQQFCSAK